MRALAWLFEERKTNLAEWLLAIWLAVLMGLLLSGCSFGIHRYGVNMGFTSPPCEDSIRCSCRVEEGGQPGP